MHDELDAQGIRRWCEAALKGLAYAREEIDALNVFPVPDGDTGTNLYLTFEGAAAAVRAEESDDLGRVVAALARGAFLGARGNSGVIVAQMARGLATALATTPRPTPADFAAAFQAAQRAGREAVARPVEGTVLTVAAAAAQAAEDAVAAAVGPDRQSFGLVARAAVRAAREALARTPSQLEVLARAGVVDAGGAGLVVLLEALDTAISGRHPLPPSRGLRVAPAVPRDVLPAGSSAQPQATPAEHPTGGGPAPSGPAAGQSPAYEVMYLLDAPDANLPPLRAVLDGLGDSLVVVGGAGEWNVHVHVDDAGAAIEAGLAAGRPRRIRVTHLRDQLPAPPTPGRVVVAVAAGPGLAQLFEGAGAVVVPTAAGRRPSTGDLLEALRSARVAHAVVLPNDPDGIAVAEAAAGEAREEGLRVAVIPTRAQVQGLSALAVHQPQRPFDTDLVAMTTAAGATRHGAVTIAAKEAFTSAGVCRPGDVLGVVEGDFAVIGSDLGEVAHEVCHRMLAAGGDLVTIVTGAPGETGDPQPLGDQLARALRRANPGVDVVVYDGGQPRYPLLLGVE